MLYHISREGQNYGPYTLEDLQRYVASGNVLPTDMARPEDGTEWVPVSQVLGSSIPPAPGGPIIPSGYGMPGAPISAAGIYPDPPNLHWIVLLVIGMLCGFFTLIWNFVQATWIRKVNPRSNALWFYIAAMVLLFGGSFLRAGLVAVTGFRNSYIGLMLPIVLIPFVLMEFGFFDLRRSMLEHYNGPEPIGLMLSPIMTFFFAPFYFQYHMTRINEMKRMARYRGAAI